MPAEPASADASRPAPDADLHTVQDALANSSAVINFLLLWYREGDRVDLGELRDSNAGELLVDLLIDANERCGNAALEALERLEMALLDKEE
jgi:hypothetical protein